MTNFIKEYINDKGQMVVEEVKQTTYEIINLTGEATVTHIGAYGRVKFVIDGVEYITLNGFTHSFIAKNADGYFNYFNYSQVNFGEFSFNEAWGKYKGEDWVEL